MLALGGVDTGETPAGMRRPAQASVGPRTARPRICMPQHLAASRKSKVGNDSSRAARPAQRRRPERSLPMKGHGPIRRARA